jgi:hypothetical protein
MRFPEGPLDTRERFPIPATRGDDCARSLRRIAPDLDRAQLRRVVEDCLDRRLFSVGDARARLLEPDMRGRPGAVLLARLLPG